MSLCLTVRLTHCCQNNSVNTFLFILFPWSKGLRGCLVPSNLSANLLSWYSNFLTIWFQSSFSVFYSFAQNMFPEIQSSWPDHCFPSLFFFPHVGHEFSSILSKFYLFFNPSSVVSFIIYFGQNSYPAFIIWTLVIFYPWWCSLYYGYVHIMFTISTIFVRSMKGENILNVFLLSLSCIAHRVVVTTCLMNVSELSKVWKYKILELTMTLLMI